MIWLGDVEKDLQEMKFKDGDRKHLIGTNGRPHLSRPRLSEGRTDEK